MPVRVLAGKCGSVAGVTVSASAGGCPLTSRRAGRPLHGHVHAGRCRRDHRVRAGDDGCRDRHRSVDRIGDERLPDRAGRPRGHGDDDHGRQNATLRFDGTAGRVVSLEPAPSA